MQTHPILVQDTLSTLTHSFYFLEIGYNVSVQDFLSTPNNLSMGASRFKYTHTLIIELEYIR
jgi:hypothetical protein